MPDFYQHELVTTLHHLADPPVEDREAELKVYAAKRPLGLVMPALYSEMEGDALPRILEELSHADYVGEVVLSMNAMTTKGFVRTAYLLDELPQRHTILWNDGPRLTALYRELEAAGLARYVPGKGTNVWMAWGYLLARGQARVIAAHDSDILSYSRDMLARLCLPGLHPAMNYEFCKSYYGRVSDRLYGRVTRLFVSPFLRALKRCVGAHPLLNFLDSFRYPLSGEFTITPELASILRVPSDWGLDIGLLCEIYRNTAERRIAQVDLGANYEHKHQHLCYDPAETDPVPARGLMKMAHEIARTLFVNLSEDGVRLSDSLFTSLRKSYHATAEEYLRRYEDDSSLNGLHYPRAEEREAVQAFAAALDVSIREYQQDPDSVVLPLSASWDRIFNTLPGFERRLLQAVESDMSGTPRPRTRRFPRPRSIVREDNNTGSQTAR